MKSQYAPDVERQQRVLAVIGESPGYWWSSRDLADVLGWERKLASQVLNTLTVHRELDRRRDEETSNSYRYRLVEATAAVSS